MRIVSLSKSNSSKNLKRASDSMAKEEEMVGTFAYRIDERIEWVYLKR
jgi:hypothetical protein